MKNENRKEASDLKRRTQAFLKKLLYSSLVVGAACYTFLFFGPFETLSGGSNAMSYSHLDVWQTLAMAAAVVFAAVTAMVVSLKGKAFRWTLTAIFALTVSGYLQSLLMNGSLGVLNGDAYRCSPGAAVFNLFVWLAIFVVCYYILHISRNVWRGVLRYGAIALLVMQIASTVSISLKEAPEGNSIKEYSLSETGMYEYSAESNVFVFVLDRLDQDYIQNVLARDKDFFESMDGFTAYSNATSVYARTQPALNHVLTGSEQAYTISSEDFFTKSWTEDGKDLLGGLQKEGYSVELYTKASYLFGEADYAVKNVDNLSRTNELSQLSVLPKLLRLSGYRCAPNVMKGLFWADTSFYNKAVYVENDAQAYEFDDVAYAPGFRTATADRSRSSFKFYHFYGSHAPYTMNADGTASEEETNSTVQTMGSFQNLFRAFEQMKALGIYEDATIIITADHGSAVSDRKPIQKATRIGLFYKPSGSAGTPLTWSSAPVSTDNIPATIARAAGLEDLTPYGTPLEDVAEDAVVTRVYFKTVVTEGAGREMEVYKYEITGDASELDNWKETQVTEEMPKENSFYK